MELTLDQLREAVEVGGWRNVLVSTTDSRLGAAIKLALDLKDVRCQEGDRPGPLVDLFIWVVNDREKERWPTVVGNLEYWQVYIVSGDQVNEQA